MVKTSAGSNLVVGIDLGGTNMQIGVVDKRNKIIGRERRKTQARGGRAQVIERLVTGVHEACASAGVTLKQVRAVGIAAPGAIDIPRGVVLDAPNLRWRDVPLRDILHKKLRRPIIVDNDVNGAVWGEYLLGAGRTHRHNPKNPHCGDDVLGVWLGTGVGGGLVINGKLFYGEFFTAGEIGQTVLFPHGKKGRRTVEDFCSRTGMSRTIQSHIKKHRHSLLRDLMDGSGTITGSKQLAKAYRKRDKLAVHVVHQAAEWLGVAIANWITVLAIDTVIIGGGVSEALGEPFLRRIRASFRKNVFPKRCRDARLVMTKLADDAGLLGAALLARSSTGKTPQHKH